MRIARRWPSRRRPPRTQEAGAALFNGLRIRLTLWYCSVLGVALVFFGVALYFGTQYFLLSPITVKASATAHLFTQQQFNGSSDSDEHPCSSHSPSGPPPAGTSGHEQQYSMELVVCFDAHGSLLPGQDTSRLPSAFLENTIVEAALQSPSWCASDTIDAGGNFGMIYRYARVIPGSTNNGIAGVVLVGEIIQPEETALSLLLKLLLGIGGGALLCAGLGGLFLSNRALAPARLAWTNQQRFIADAAHELRTPLTLLRADAEVLLRGRKRLEAEDAALLEDIVAEANHMGNITTNLLTLARLDNRFSHREHEVVDLAQLVQQGVRRVQALAAERKITVECEQTDHPQIIGDPLFLEQAIMVLLDNAVKYNRQGGRVDAHTRVRDGQVIVEVRDTGIGIAAEHLPYLGQRFYRVDKARSRAAGGTGLGLSIARSIAVAHGGQLTIKSTPDQGTMVTLTFPVAQRTPHRKTRKEENTSHTVIKS
jgi:signal transduction histidine kinase